MAKKILIPVDGSEHSEKAVEFAATIAAQDDAEVCVVHVLKRERVPEALAEYIKKEHLNEETPASLVREAQETEGSALVGNAEAKLKGSGIGNISTELIWGDPAEAIIEYARKNDYDVIVMGSRGLGGVKSLFLGSVSSKVCHAAGSTCVTVK
jgi:nucleotide-binding universal stress UspA family protein